MGTPEQMLSWIGTPPSRPSIVCSARVPRHAQMQGAGAAESSDGVVDAEVGFEGGLKADDVVVAMLAPAVSGDIGGVADLQLGDRGSGVGNAGSWSQYVMDCRDQPTGIVDVLSRLFMRNRRGCAIVAQLPILKQARQDSGELRW